MVFNLEANTNTIPFLTFVPGDYLDIPVALAIDGANHPYVTGFTYSSVYPTTATGNTAFQSTSQAFDNGKGPVFIFGPGFGTSNAFITELDPTSPDCSDLLYFSGTPPTSSSNSAAEWNSKKE